MTKPTGEHFEMGRITAVEGDAVSVQLDSGQQIRVPITDLAKRLYELRLGERGCVSFWFGEPSTLTGFLTSN